MRLCVCYTGCIIARGEEAMIHICYSGNKRVFPGLLLSVLSVVRHTRRPVRVHVLSMDMHEQDEAFVPFSRSQMQILDAVLKEANPASGAELLDVTAHYRATLAAGKKRRQLLHPLYPAAAVSERAAGSPRKALIPGYRHHVRCRHRPAVRHRPHGL